MDSWHSYSKVWNIGHPAALDLFQEEVLVEEKVDGSQFSFGVFDGQLRCRSKGREFDPHGPDDLFAPAALTARRLADEGLLKDGWTYRGETLKKPKHNVLAYDRVPVGNVILWDIGVGDNRYLGRDEKEAEAARIGLECVPVLQRGRVGHANQLTELLNTTSVLGGQKIEGFVVKNYHRFDKMGKTLMGKYVSEAFKEIHRPEFKKANPTQGDIQQALVSAYRSEARWQKAVQHLAEAGVLKNSPEDIGPVIKEVRRDIHQECAEVIKEELYRWFMKRSGNLLTHGVAEWYKKKLLEGAFGNVE